MVSVHHGMCAGGMPDAPVPNPPGPTLSSDSVSALFRGGVTGFTALTGAGERGHCYNTEDPMVCVFMGRPPKLTVVERFWG